MTRRRGLVSVLLGGILLACAGCQGGGGPPHSAAAREENRVDDRWMDVHRWGLGSDLDR